MSSKNNQQITVYYPNMRHELGWWHCWVIMARNVWNARELIWQLFRRDFVGAYKKSWLGMTWFFIMPIMGIVSWVFLQKTGLLKPGDVGVPYPVYVLIGTSMYTLFRQFYYAATGTLNAGREFIQQVNFPHEAMLFKQTASQVASICVSFILNLVIMMAFGVFPSWKFVFLPLVALPLFLYAAAFGLMLSMLSVVLVDVSRIVDIIVGFGMYLTPVIYSDKISNPIIQTIIKWNPLTYLVCSCRDIMIYGHLYKPIGYYITAFFSLIAFLIAWRLFFVSEDKLVERMI